MSQISLRESGYSRNPLMILCVRNYYACHDPRLTPGSLKFLSELTCFPTYFNEVSGDLVYEKTLVMDTVGIKK